MSFSQLMAILLARKWIVASVFGITVFLTTIISFLLPKTYTASATLVVNAKGADPITGVMLPAALMPGYIATQLDIIGSKNVALRVVDKLNIVKNPTAIAQYEKATQGKGDIRLWYAEQFLENLDIKPSRESSVIEVIYHGPDPDFAATMANAFSEAYLETNLQLKTDPAKHASQFFNQQLNGLREKVEKAQSKLSEFQQAHGITSSEARLDIEMARLDELSSQLVAAQAQTYDSRSKQTQISRDKNGDSPEILANGLIQGLKSQLVQAETKLTEVSQRLGVNHPQYQAAWNDVENLKQSIQKEVAKTSNSVGQTARVSQMRESEIKAALEAQKARILKLKNEQDEMAVLVREVESAQRIYDNALLRFGQTNLESQSGNTDIAILNPAMPPLKHSSPKITINILLSFFLGGLLGVGFAIANELFDRRIRSEDDMIKINGLPVLSELNYHSKKPPFKLNVALKKWLNFRSLQTKLN